MTAPVLPDRRPSLARLVGFVVLLAGVAAGLGVFSAFPWPGTAPDAAMLKVAFKHVAPPAEAERAALSPQELAKLPRHMRPQGAARSQGGTRRDTRLRVEFDGRLLLDRTYRPGGLRHDGPTFAYEELPVTPGRHRLAVSLADTAAGAGETAGRGPWRLDREVEVQPGRVLLVEFSDEAGLTLR